jgi:PEP-CTERM motif
MKIESFLRMPILVSVLAGPAFASLLVVAPPDQSFIEQTTNPLTFVTFTVTNTSNTALILDYALELIDSPAEVDDQLANNGFVSATTFLTGANIPGGGNVGTYTFGVYNPKGDPTDCCGDDGINFIDFYIEMSPMVTAPSAVNITTNAGYGQFLFPIGGSSTGTENGTVLTNLLNCFGTPATCPGVVNGPLLFSNGIQGNPFPAETIVNLTDTPEPATLWGAGIGCALLGVSRIIRGRRT